MVMTKRLTRMSPCLLKIIRAAMALVILTSLASGAPTNQTAQAENRNSAAWDIYEAVFRQKPDPSPAAFSSSNLVCVLTLGFAQDTKRWKDPPPQLLNRLADLKQEIIPPSEAVPPVSGQTRWFDRSGKGAYLCWMIITKWVTEDEVLVEFGKRYVPLVGGGLTARVKRHEDGWKVESTFGAWIE